MQNRLKELRTYLKMTQLQMANTLGVKQSGYSMIENGKVSLTDRNKLILSEKYHVSIKWLNGEDCEMFLDDAVAGIIKTTYPEKNKKQLQQEVLDKLVEQELNPQKSFIKGVPYYNVDFIGGFDTILNDQTVNPEYLIDFKKYNEATCWCNVTGHSMEPEITHGDIIALKKIEDFSFLPFGEVYAIVTTNGMRTIKRIGPASSPDKYSLIPANKSPEYGIQEIPKNMIFIIYQVLGCMKRL